MLKRNESKTATIYFSTVVDPSVNFKKRKLGLESLTPRVSLDAKETKYSAEDVEHFIKNALDKYDEMNRRYMDVKFKTLFSLNPIPHAPPAPPANEFSYIS
jgi:hypothetical protein